MLGSPSRDWIDKRIVRTCSEGEASYEIIENNEGSRVGVQTLFRSSSESPIRVSSYQSFY